jgi:hypothetical protein
MNEETIEYRLDQIEKKLDTVTELLKQTTEQEIRIANMESAIRELRNSKKNATDRWLNPLIAAVVSGLIAFIFLKVGLK